MSHKRSEKGDSEALSNSWKHLTSLIDASFKFGAEGETVLHNLSFSVAQDTLAMITHLVDSGKSAFLLSLRVN